jgi:hypothetical protein
MKSYDAYVRSGEMHKTVGAATREAGAIARAHGLPPAGTVKVPAHIAAALAKPPVRKTSSLAR